MSDDLTTRIAEAVQKHTYRNWTVEERLWAIHWMVTAVVVMQVASMLVILLLVLR